MHRYTMRLTWIEGAYSVVGFRGTLATLVKIIVGNWPS